MHDDSSGNGQVSPPHDSPDVTITFDHETQAMRLNLNTQTVKTWEFCLALLDMAKREAETKRQMAMMAAMQQQQMEARANAHLAGKILRG